MWQYKTLSQLIINLDPNDDEWWSPLTQFSLFDLPYDIVANRSEPFEQNIIKTSRLSFARDCCFFFQVKCAFAPNNSGKKED